MFETSQREAFCDAWKAMKSVFGSGAATDPDVEAQDAPSTPVSWEGKPLLSPPLGIAPFADIPIVFKVDSRPHPKLKS